MNFGVFKFPGFCKPRLKLNLITQIKQIMNVAEVKELKNFERSNEAKELLERLVRDCGPLMTRKGWKLKCLKEFFPVNQGLLGMNCNKNVIMIRLRPSNDKNSFYSYDEFILGTMIHELTHMQISAHSSDFYRLKDELEDEVNKDMLGIKQFGVPLFSGTARLLGGKPVPVNDKASLREIMLTRALKRETSGALVTSGQVLDNSLKTRKRK